MSEANSFTFTFYFLPLYWWCMARQRPIVFVDVKTREVTPFRVRGALINLSAPRVRHVPIGEIAKGLLVAVLIISGMFGSVTAPIIGNQLFAAQSIEEERKALEEQLKALEAEISANEAMIQTYQSKGKTLSGEISTLNSKINRLNLQIQAITVSLTKLNGEITANKAKVQTTEVQLDRNKQALTKLLQVLYETKRVTLVEMLLKSNRFSDFFGGVNSLLETQTTLATTIHTINMLRDELIDQQDLLAMKKNDAESLKSYQDLQRKLIAQTREQKKVLLVETKGQESKYQDIVKQTKKTAAQIRNRLFELLGGGELTFEEAYKYAQFAENATGVRAAFILGVLDRESALGQNVGRCTYQQSMAPGPPRSRRDDVAPFLVLTKELGINPETISVSCANRDGAFGGAMGPAQFLPTTWVLYRDRIKDLTGSNPPSPWRNGDAFVATALYLQDRGAVSTDVSKEKRAAAIYYCGSNWTRYACTVYANNVVAAAARFQEDINLLRGI